MAAIPAPPRPPLGRVVFDVLLWGGLIAVLVSGFGPVEMKRLGLLFSNAGNMREYAADLFRPDFGPWRVYVAATWLTIQMALWGTFLALLIAVPLGLLAARNIAPAWVVLPVRRVLDLLRAMPDLVIGTLFIVAVGVGPLAGVLALALNTGGVLGKLFSEAVEAIDPQPVEGIRSTGANALEEIVFGVIPQVMPLWISYSLYRFESNVRSASVVGMVGAGGIGVVLYEVIRGFQYAQTSAVLLIIILFVTSIDLISSVIRKKFI